MRLQRRGARRIKAGRFVDHDPGVLPRQVPGLQRGQRQRQGGGEFVGLGQQGRGRAFADRQGTRDLGDDAHLLGQCAGPDSWPALPWPRTSRQTRKPGTPSSRPPWHQPAPKRRARPGTHPPAPAADPDRRNPDCLPRGAHSQPTPQRTPKRPPPPRPLPCFPYPNHPARVRQKRRSRRPMWITSDQPVLQLGQAFSGKGHKCTFAPGRCGCSTLSVAPRRLFQPTQGGRPCTLQPHSVPSFRPTLLRRLARQDAPQFSAAARAAKEALSHVRSVQESRAQPSAVTPPGLRQVQPGPPNRSIYDAAGSREPSRQARPQRGRTRFGRRSRWTRPTTDWATRTGSTQRSSAGILSTD